MECSLNGIPQVIVYLDDILITGRTKKEHLYNLQLVLQRLSTAGLRLKQEKCEFLVPSISYLGHKIDSQGLHPLPDKIDAIVNAANPKSLTELKAFLGLLTQSAKSLLTSDNVLVHFDPFMDIVLACDASAYGIGAVLAHKMADGSEHPVGFASRTLSPAEQIQSDRERNSGLCLWS